MLLPLSKSFSSNGFERNQHCWVHSSLFLLLSIIPLYGCITVYSFLNEKYLDYFQSLAIMNKATINIHIQILCEHKFSFP